MPRGVLPIFCSAPPLTKPQFDFRDVTVVVVVVVTMAARLNDAYKWIKYCASRGLIDQIEHLKLSGEVIAGGICGAMSVVWWQS